VMNMFQHFVIWICSFVFGCFFSIVPLPLEFKEDSSWQIHSCLDCSKKMKEYVVWKSGGLFSLEKIHFMIWTFSMILSSSFASGVQRLLLVCCSFASS